PMNDRTKQLWLPGLTMLLATMALLRISQLSALHPYYGVLFLRLSASHPTPYWHVAMYNPWLCVLPFLGAAGAYWARRAGSGRAIQSAVGLFPLLVFVASFLAIRHFRLAEVLTLKWAAVDMLNGIAIPGVALLLGILPFLRRSSAHRRMV
ncbi:MAG: hypothetical protein ACRD37_08540, partial [Candidatus Acidiferrales bacterium]